jgi:DNA-binding transcriptional regulator YiaG
MSTKLSLKEALGRRAKTPDDRQKSSASQAIRVVLVANEIAQPVELARVLVRYGLSLRKAHDILNRISDGACVPVELSGASAKGAIAELSGLGVSAHTIQIPEVDIKRLRETQKLSQTEFASLYGLELDTLQNWEQGRNIPDRSTKVLMKLIERFPDEVFLALTDRERAGLREGRRSPTRRRMDRAAKPQAR